MLVSHSHRFVFVANGKTGTTSLERALSAYADGTLVVSDQPGFYYGKHIPAPMLRELLGQRMWESYFTFGVVRNPATRFVSLLRHHHREGSFRFREFRKGPRSYLRYYLQMRKLNIPSKLTVIDLPLVTQIMEIQSVLRIRLECSTNFQYPMFYDFEGRLSVKQVVKYENLQEHLPVIAQQCKLPELKLPVLNRGTGYDPESLRFTAAARDLVEETYAQDFECFDYRWPEHLMVG